MTSYFYILDIIQTVIILSESGCGSVREREKKIIHHKANNQYYKQNELMWQAAREEIPV